MATIRSFEDIESWKKARLVCKKLGSLIDEGKFKNSYRLINQIEGSSGSIMDNIAEGFERGQKVNLFSSWDMQKLLVVNCDHNFIGPWIEII